jgi:hypothetical protein
MYDGGNMARISEDFGRAVQRELDDKGWSHQRACVATSIPSATIGRMALGIVPGEDHIIRWAKGLRQPINQWLILAGYEPIPEELIRVEDQEGSNHVIRVDDLVVKLRTTTDRPLTDAEMDEIKRAIREIREGEREGEKETDK